MPFPILRVFTVNAGVVTEGAKVEKFHLKGPKVDIFAILIGEEGRGRQRGVLPVSVPEGQAVIQTVSQSLTGSGKPKLNCMDPHPDDIKVVDPEKVVVVFRTQIGFRGGNEHTGDWAGWVCECGEKGTEKKAPEKCPKCDKTPKAILAPFPGTILCSGTIAQGDAGRMGSGQQHVAIMPKGVVFRTAYYGRLYGAPAAHYYLWNGKDLLSATKAERELSEIF